VGLDFSPEMLEIAATKAANDDLSNVEFLQADASAPNLARRYDLATVQNAPLYLEAMAKAVCPGGLVVVMYPFVFARPAGRAVFRAMRRVGLSPVKIVPTL